MARKLPSFLPGKAKDMVAPDGDDLSLMERMALILSEGISPQPADPLTAQAEKSLYAFVEQAWPVLEPTNQFVPGWHIGCVCEHLEAVSKLQIRNLLICEPPRHAKSILAAVCWFCWSWTFKPGTRWLYTSYASHLSTRDSEKCRTLLRSKWYQERWGLRFRINQHEDTKIKFVNDRQGYRIATSVGGVGTGEGGDFIVSDDINRADDALSIAARERAIHNWDQTLSTRGNNPATVCKVIIQQRIHENDLVGHVLASERGYEALILPAEYESKRYFVPDKDNPNATKPRDAIVPTSLQLANPKLMDNEGGSGRKEDGDTLWPARFNTEELDKLKVELAVLGTAGQLQQRPAPAQGSIFQEGLFRYFRDELLHAHVMVYFTDNNGQNLKFAAHEINWFQTVDTALKVTDTSAWTVVGTFGRTPMGHLLVWDIWRERVLVPQQYECICQLRSGSGLYHTALKKWVVPGAARPWPFKILYQAVEPKASGIGLIQASVQDGRPFRQLKKSDQDKVRRASNLATMFEANLVYFREAARASWLTDYEGELLAFPNGTYADQVDVSAYGAILCMEDAITRARVDGELLADGGDIYQDDNQDITRIGDVEIRWEDESPWWRNN